MTTVASTIVNGLADLGVRQVWGVVGDALNPITEAIRLDDRHRVGRRAPRGGRRFRRRRPGPAHRHHRRVHGHGGSRLAAPA